METTIVLPGKKLRSRIAALLLCAFSLLIILTASELSASHAGHNCSGENCPLCTAIRDLSLSVRTMGAGVSAAAATFALFVTVSELPQRIRERLFALTPVTLKQRLLY